MYGRVTEMRCISSPIQTKARKYMQNEKKKLSVALQNQKNCIDYAIAVCVEMKKFPNNAYLQLRYRI